MDDSIPTSTDEALGYAAGRDVEGAFALLLRRYQAPLLSFLRRFASSPSDAEDLLQETVFRLYAARSQYRSKWRYRTWVFTIARRVAIDSIRRRNSEARALRDRGTAQTTEWIDRTDAADSASGVWAIARRVLTLEQADALWLFHVEEIPPREIARILNRSWVSVKTMLHRARHRVRAEMSKLEEMQMGTARGGLQ